METRRDGQTTFPGEDTQSETDSASGSNSTTSPSQTSSKANKSTILPPSVASRASKASWRKGLQVLERRQRERGIVDSSLSIFAEGSTLAHSAAPSNLSNNSMPSNTSLSEVNSQENEHDMQISSASEEEDRPEKEDPVNLFDQLMENLSHPSQILGISTSSSSPLEEESTENESKHAVHLMKNNACTTSKVAGGSFDMIAFHDINSPPTSSELSSSSDLWTADDTFAGRFTSKEDIKKKFQDYMELGGIGASRSWSDKRGGAKARKKKWAKSRTKAIRSFKQSKARLMKGVNVKLPAKAVFGKFKKKTSKAMSETRSHETTPPLQQRMKSALSKTISGVSTKILSKDHRKIAHTDVRSAASSVISADNKEVITLQAYQDPTFSLKAPTKSPSGFGALTKKTIAPWNQYMQRKSLQYRVGTTKAISKLRRSAQKQYEHIGRKQAMSPLAQNVFKEATESTCLVVEKEYQANIDADSAPALIIKDTDGEIETAVQTGLVSQEDSMDTTKTAEKEADFQARDNETNLESIEIARTMTLLSDKTPSEESKDVEASLEGDACWVPKPKQELESYERTEIAIPESSLNDCSHPEKTSNDIAENTEHQPDTTNLSKQPSTSTSEPSDFGAKEKGIDLANEAALEFASLKIVERFNAAKAKDEDTKEYAATAGDGTESVSHVEFIDKLCDKPIEDRVGATPAAECVAASPPNSSWNMRPKRHSWRSKKVPQVVDNKPPVALSEENTRNNSSNEGYNSPRGVLTPSMKSKLAKRLIPNILARTQNSPTASRTIKSSPKFRRDSGDTGGVSPEEPSQVAETSMKPIPDVLPLSKTASAAAASRATGSVHSTGGVPISIAKTTDDSVEMVVHEAGLEDVPSTPVTSELEEPNAVSTDLVTHEKSDEMRGENPETVEQELARPPKGRSSIKLRAMEFLKPKRRFSSQQNTVSGALEESHSDVLERNAETEVHQRAECPQLAELTEEQVGESVPTATAAADASVPKQTADEAETHADQDPKGVDDVQEKDADENEETAENRSRASTRKPEDFLPDLAWLIPAIFCEAGDDHGIPEGWVDRCGASMESNGSFTSSDSSVSWRKDGGGRRRRKKKRIPFLDYDTLKSDSYDNDDDDDGSPVTSPELLLNQILAFNCRYGCDEEGLGIVESSVSSVTSNSTNVDEDSGIQSTTAVEKQPELPVDSSAPKVAKDSVDDAKSAPSQWIEFPERQTRNEKINEEKKTIARRGVKKFLRLVKRKRKVEKGTGDLLTRERNRPQGQFAVHDAAGNEQNEASLISFLSESAVSTNSWTNNSDVFSGVGSGVSPRRKVEPRD